MLKLPYEGFWLLTREWLIAITALAIGLGLLAWRQGRLWRAALGSFLLVAGLAWLALGLLVSADPRGDWVFFWMSTGTPVAGAVLGTSVYSLARGRGKSWPNIARLLAAIIWLCASVSWAYAFGAGPFHLLLSKWWRGYSLAALPVFAALLTFVLVLRRRTRAWRNVLGLALALVLVAWGVRFTCEADELTAGADRSLLAACKNNLKQIGGAVARYAVDQEGRMPRAVADLKDWGYLLDESVFTCPGAEAAHVGGVFREEYRYLYRPLETPKDDDIISWDGRPHVVHRRVFWLLKRSYRNVLFANGEIKSIPEEQFQALGLAAGE